MRARYPRANLLETVIIMIIYPFGNLYILLEIAGNLAVLHAGDAIYFLSPTHTHRRLYYYGHWKVLVIYNKYGENMCTLNVALCLPITRCYVP